MKYIPQILLACCATAACGITVVSATPWVAVPAYWQLSSSGAIAIILACSTVLMCKTRDPLGAVILPGMLATFSAFNLILVLLPDTLVVQFSGYLAPVPATPSLFMLLIALCCWQNDRRKECPWQRKVLAFLFMAFGVLVLVAYTIPQSFSWVETLTSQATITGAILAIVFGRALWLLSVKVKPAAQHWRQKLPDQQTLLVVNLEGRITKASATKAEFLGSRRHRLIGQEFQALFNQQTLSNSDLAKLNRALSWAQSGKVPVATLVTYRTPRSAPRLLDTLIQPTLVDGQVSGIHFCAREITEASVLLG